MLVAQPVRNAQIQCRSSLPPPRNQAWLIVSENVNGNAMGMSPPGIFCRTGPCWVHGEKGNGVVVIQPALPGNR